MDLIEPVGADHVLGPAQARIVVVEYGDFECPNCKQAAPAVEMLLKRFEGRVRFVYRHFPLEEVHPHALQAAEAAECAGAQHKFWEMHQRCSITRRAEPRELHGYAAQLGLDMARFSTDLTSHAIWRESAATLTADGGAAYAVRRVSLSTAAGRTCRSDCTCCSMPPRPH